MKGGGRTVIVTCEHGGNQVPSEYGSLFVGQETLLDSHRGYDPGALTLSEYMAEQLNAPLFFSKVTRLLVDLNRSLPHSDLFGEQVKGFNRSMKDAITAQYYKPYRDTVRNAISSEIKLGRQVVHLSIHSFTPVFSGQLRLSDVGLLYDPTRYQEKSFCRHWRKELRAARHLTVRFNWPYRGIADGLTRSLRRIFSDDHYLGIEVEINQGLLQVNGQFPEAVCLAIFNSLQQCLVTQDNGA